MLLLALEAFAAVMCRSGKSAVVLHIRYSIHMLSNLRKRDEHPTHTAPVRSISPFTVKPLMTACLLFCKPNKTAKLKGTDINCRPKEAEITRVF